MKMGGWGNEAHYQACVYMPLCVFPRCFLVWSLCAFHLVNADAIELTDMFGEIQSPNFPDSYPSDSEVTWNISVPDGFRIKLYFMHFDLESSYLCEYDYVKVSSVASCLGKR